MKEAAAIACFEVRDPALWDQIARRYAERDTERVWFEVLNEPHDRLQGKAWNRLLAESLAVARRTNPRRERGDRPALRRRRAGFGVFDGSEGGWVEPLHRAMLPNGG